jgi:hypothetical protein
MMIMMARSEITLDPEVQRRVRQRASDLGISFSEYVRRLVERDLSQPKAVVGIEALFDLGSSGGSNIARDKHEMIGEAVDFEAVTSLRRKAPAVLLHIAMCDNLHIAEVRPWRQIWQSTTGLSTRRGV